MRESVEVTPNHVRPRKVLLGQQWALLHSGQWNEITRGSYTTDATGNHRQRMDFAGGVEGSQFYLRLDGFFNETVMPQKFSRTATGIPPAVDAGMLPNNHD